ncbi:unnamed protein product [Chondrus crispus]|uniref:Uncharacterized protein n=1 Tax=Chondrus crispus TaxID=2769 RepID=R7QGI2_CHOCR|nr:unnamed protein product [Chondrus crispus]CDF36561.1 unnamed protein product [Chondrus crispus]|eukprot:XP_005716380.1 unnamed protein product [Chondrus crispus]
MRTLFFSLGCFLETPLACSRRAERSLVKLECSLSSRPCWKH